MTDALATFGWLLLVCLGCALAFVLGMVLGGCVMWLLLASPFVLTGVLSGDGAIVVSMVAAIVGCIAGGAAVLIAADEVL